MAARKIKKIRYKLLAKIRGAIAAVAKGETAIAGSMYGVMKVTSKSDVSGSSVSSIGAASTLCGYALAYDSDGEVLLKGWMDPFDGTQAAEFADVKTHPDGGWVACGYSRGDNTRVYSNDGTYLTVTAASAQDWQGIFCKWDSDGQLEWARRTGYINDHLGWSGKQVEATGICVLSDGRIFSLGYELGANTSTERQTTFDTAKAIIYPKVTSGTAAGSFPGTWMVELGKTTGEGLSIDVFDAGPVTANVSCLLDPDYMSLTTGHDDTYVVLISNTQGRPSSNQDTIVVGREKTGTFTTRPFTSYSSSTRKMYMVKVAIDGAPLHAITARSGIAVPPVDNTAERRSNAASEPIIDSDGNITFMVQVDHNMETTDLDRNPSAYASVDVLDSGSASDADRWSLVRTDTDFGKPSDVGLNKIAASMAAGNIDVVQGSLSLDTDGYYCALSYNATADSTTFFEDGSTVDTITKGNKLFKLDSSGNITWVTTYQEASISQVNYLPHINKFSTGPLANKVIGIAEVCTTNVQSAGPTNVSDGLLAYDVGDSWGADGETNGNLMQLVYIAYDTDGEVIPEDCFVMASLSGGTSTSRTSTFRHGGFA